MENHYSMPTDYSFVLILSSKSDELYNPINIEIDNCNDSYELTRCKISLYLKDSSNTTIIKDKFLDTNKKYLIQTKDLGKFGYYSVGKPIHIYEDQEKAESDIYHFYFMEFAK